MVRYITSLLINIKEKILTLRYFLKIYFFKSPMDELSSIKYLSYDLISKLCFKLKREQIKVHPHNAVLEFNKKGFATFTNKKIEKDCINILNKLKNDDKCWDKNKRYIGSPSNKFESELISIFKEGGVDNFIKSVFNSDYYIFYHILYKSNRFDELEKPQGSELWHSDAGPGICMNLMICHTPIDEYNGSMKIINWEKSIKLLTDLYLKNKKLNNQKIIKNSKKLNNRLFLREQKCKILEKQIKKESINFFQPISKNSGTIFAFRNNCVHAGGYTEIDSERIVSVLHIYPSAKKTSIRKKFKSSHIKVSGYPDLETLIKNN